MTDLSQTIKIFSSPKVVVISARGIPGARGEKGDSGNNNVFIQTSAPTGVTGQYMWIDTSNGDINIWIEDGE